uniref:ATP synthase complex subunit 8 n=1 Tax=Staphylinidae sp. BMNH 1274190 TaxID=1796555 RepID=A0A140EG74_9COLE|nr:ATP synthase F0 subunit 8 [Staphylinidae sp. BMNH 1274190]
MIPQMAPLNWLMLFMMFVISFMMFNYINYYMFIYNPKSIKSSLKLKLMNWKW